MLLQYLLILWAVWFMNIAHCKDLMLDSLKNRNHKHAQQKLPIRATSSRGEKSILQQLLSSTNEDLQPTVNDDEELVVLLTEKSQLVKRTKGAKRKEPGVGRAARHGSSRGNSPDSRRSSGTRSSSSSRQVSPPASRSGSPSTSQKGSPPVSRQGSITGSPRASAQLALQGPDSPRRPAEQPSKKTKTSPVQSLSRPSTPRTSLERPSSKVGSPGASMGRATSNPASPRASLDLTSLKTALPSPSRESTSPRQVAAGRSGRSSAEQGRKSRESGRRASDSSTQRSGTTDQPSRESLRQKFGDANLQAATSARRPSQMGPGRVPQRGVIPVQQPASTQLARHSAGSAGAAGAQTTGQSVRSQSTGHGGEIRPTDSSSNIARVSPGVASVRQPSTSIQRGASGEQGRRLSAERSRRTQGQTIRQPSRLSQAGHALQQGRRNSLDQARRASGIDPSVPAIRSSSLSGARRPSGIYVGPAGLRSSSIRAANRASLRGASQRGHGPAIVPTRVAPSTGRAAPSSSAQAEASPSASAAATSRGKTVVGTVLDLANKKGVMKMATGTCTFIAGCSYLAGNSMILRNSYQPGLIPVVAAGGVITASGILTAASGIRDHYKKVSPEETHAATHRARQALSRSLSTASSTVSSVTGSFSIPITRTRTGRRTRGRTRRPLVPEPIGEAPDSLEAAEAGQATGAQGLHTQSPRPATVSSAPPPGGVQMTRLSSALVGGGASASAPQIALPRTSPTQPVSSTGYASSLEGAEEGRVNSK